ncbi:MAG: AraC family transcriptional regulator [Acidobacteriota bacterium]
MQYREISPSERLSSVVVSFWEFAVPLGFPSPIVHEIMPDGCVSLFYIRNLARRIHIVGLSGLYLEAVTKPIGAGDTIWGMRISPAVLSAVIAADGRRLFNTSYFGPDACPHLLGGLAEQLTVAGTLEEAAEILEKRVLLLIGEGFAPDRQIADAVRTIEERRGEVRVDELAAMQGLSTRQFQRRFQASSGLTPKQYIRTRRMRAAAVDLVENRGRDWAGLAADLGFADQSHLAHEFNALTSRSPNSFAKKMYNIYHGKLVR